MNSTNEDTPVISTNPQSEMPAQKEEIKDKLSTFRNKKIAGLIVIVVLLIGLSAAVLLSQNKTGGGQSGAYFAKCLPLPSCYAQGKCPQILTQKPANLTWCAPTNPTPTIAPVTSASDQQLDSEDTQINNNLNQLNTDQQGVDQSLNDKPTVLQ